MTCLANCVINYTCNKGIHSLTNRITPRLATCIYPLYGFLLLQYAACMQLQKQLHTGLLYIPELLLSCLHPVQCLISQHPEEELSGGWEERNKTLYLCNSLSKESYHKHSSRTTTNKDENFKITQLRGERACFKWKD